MYHIRYNILNKFVSYVEQVSYEGQKITILSLKEGQRWLMQRLTRELTEGGKKWRKIEFLPKWMKL